MGSCQTISKYQKPRQRVVLHENKWQAKILDTKQQIVKFLVQIQREANSTTNLDQKKAIKSKFEEIHALKQKIEKLTFIIGIDQKQQQLASIQNQFYDIVQNFKGQEPQNTSQYDSENTFDTIISNNRQSIHPKKYLLKLLRSKQQVDRIYRRFTLDRIQYWRKQAQLEFTTFDYALNLTGKKINMAQFCQYDWNSVGWLALNLCDIDDQGWKIFAQNADRFSKLKFLDLRSNQFENVQKQDLNKFKFLQCVDFGDTKFSKTPLNKKSIKQIKKSMRQRSKLRVNYYS